MDENTDLLLANAVKVENWEDQEKATYDVEVLRQEFNKRLYSRKAEQAAVLKNGAAKSGK